MIYNAQSQGKNDICQSAVKALFTSVQNLLGLVSISDGLIALYFIFWNVGSRSSK